MNRREFLAAATAANITVTMLTPGLVDQKSYAYHIWLDPESPYTGTQFDLGIQRRPVNNYQDALGIAQKYGWHTFNLVEVQ